jgi:hypothetical protein
VHGEGLEPSCLAAAEPKAFQSEPNSRDIEETRSIGDPSRPEKGGARPALGQSRGNPAGDTESSDQVERALAQALSQAADAGRFDVVAQLAKELEARRLLRLGNVVPLGRSKRGK